MDLLTQTLPEDALAEVLRRLPQHSLAAARCVRKTWRAIIDARRLMQLAPLPLAGFFINFWDLRHTDYFFRPSTEPTTKIRGDLIEYLPYKSILPDKRIYVDDHCNGLLLLFTGFVVNPATRQWAELPPYPPAQLPPYPLVVHQQYIVFDPTVSPHYEVFRIPLIQHYQRWKRMQTPHISELQSFPSPFVVQVFSSRTGKWEERSFLRHGDDVRGNVQTPRIGTTKQDYAVYWRGHLYVHFHCIIRMSLSNCTYQVIKPPVDTDTMKRPTVLRLGRSEKGVYFAMLDHQYRLRVWILNESCGDICWLLKHDNNLTRLLACYCHHEVVRGPWLLENTNYPNRPRKNDEEQNFEWNSDNENVFDAGDTGEHRRGLGEVSILGFHPNKEIIFLDRSLQKVLAYHMNRSKCEDLGCLRPENYLSFNPDSYDVDDSFPYTPCWIWELPGSNKSESCTRALLDTEVAL